MKKLFYFTTIIFIACQSSNKDKKIKHPKPANVLSEKQLEDVMVDIQLLEAAQQNKIIATSKDSVTFIQYYSELFKKHHIRKGQYDSSMMYYKEKPEIMEKIYDKVLTRLNEIDAAQSK